MQTGYIDETAKDRNRVFPAGFASNGLASWAPGVSQATRQWDLEPVVVAGHHHRTCAVHRDLAGEEPCPYCDCTGSHAWTCRQNAKGIVVFMAVGAFIGATGLVLNAKNLSYIGPCRLSRCQPGMVANHLSEDPR